MVPQVPCGCTGINSDCPDGCGREFSTRSLHWSGGVEGKGKYAKCDRLIPLFSHTPLSPVQWGQPAQGSQTNSPSLRWCREESETSHLFLSRSVQLKSSFNAQPGSQLCSLTQPRGLGVLWSLFHPPRFITQAPFEPSQRVLLKSSQSKDISFWVLAGNLKPWVMVAAGQMLASKKTTATSRKFWIFHGFLRAEQLKMANWTSHLHTSVVREGTTCCDTEFLSSKYLLTWAEGETGTEEVWTCPHYRTCPRHCAIGFHNRPNSRCGEEQSQFM